MWSAYVSVYLHSQCVEVFKIGLDKCIWSDLALAVFPFMRELGLGSPEVLHQVSDLLCSSWCRPWFIPRVLWSKQRKCFLAIEAGFKPILICFTKLNIQIELQQLLYQLCLVSHLCDWIPWTISAPHLILPCDYWIQGVWIKHICELLS